MGRSAGAVALDMTLVTLGVCHPARAVEPPVPAPARGRSDSPPADPLSRSHGAGSRVTVTVTVPLSERRLGIAALLAA